MRENSSKKTLPRVRVRQRLRHRKNKKFNSRYNNYTTQDRSSRKPDKEKITRPPKMLQVQRKYEENSDELDSLPPTEDIYLKRLEIQFSFQRKKNS